MRQKPSFPYLGEHEYFQFPPVESSNPDGIVATGGNLSPGMLLSAYRQGIFPWYSAGEPILWWSPDPRFVLFRDELVVSKSLRRTLRRDRFSISFDTRFHQVLEGCKHAPRPGQDGTWITREMQDGYARLHELGYAHSVEATVDGELAGGLYGVALGHCFFGESMFTRVPDASKVALVALVRSVAALGFPLVDSQVYTPHLARFGAREIPRAEYLSLLNAALREPTLRGNWYELIPAVPTHELV
jgi:leucyl/phenylalanyl-tRNA---protein transferase